MVETTRMGRPNCIWWGRGPTVLLFSPLSCLGCDWLVLSVISGFNFWVNFKRLLPVSGRGPSTINNPFINVQNTIWGHSQGLQKVHVGLKLEWSLYDKYCWHLRRFPFRVAFSHDFEAPWGVINASMQCPLSDHSSMQGSGGSCGLVGSIGNTRYGITSCHFERVKLGRELGTEPYMRRPQHVILIATDSLAPTRHTVPSTYTILIRFRQ